MSQPKNPPLAIIGIGCRFPGGAEDPEAFWNLLINGKSGIVQTPEDRWNVERYYHEDSSIPVKMHTKWGGFVKNVDQFDAAFFGISPREAQRMDPQQRWLLETAWEALEDGGIRPQDARGTKTGVFVGIASNEYGSIQMMSEEDIDVHTNSGSTLSIASNRISYLFDLKGPSVSVDTACSSALVAVNLACRSIWSGDCEMALAGGVNALLMPDASIGFSKASMLSPSGQCFAFDDRANGYVRGEGAGMIAIKPLDKAIEDGDPIYATIRASVINQDGNTSSMTVPGEDSQAAMLEQAYDEAGLEPSAVCYMEAHGTGTPVGDPIETRALGRVLSRGRDESNKCIIGSVKTNIGHLESGSGIAGLVKAALVLHKDTVPPNLNFKNPNPNIPFEEMKLKVPTEPTPLPHQNGALPVTAVNSFGFGGTNAHIVLEQYDGPNARAEKAPAEKAPSRPYILPISAGSETSLENYARAYRDFLKGERDIDISEICYSAATHKNQHEEQICITGESRAEIRRRLSAWLSPARDTTGIVTKKKAITNTAPVFVFTGQGAQWWAMGQELLEREPVFRATIEKIDAELSKLADWSLLEEMTRDQESSRINETNIAQPAIFALQVALAELWKSWGVEPEKVVGHSVGEVAAAYVAGAYSLEDAAKIIFHRSRLQHTTGGKGRMVAVGISPAEGRSVIRGREAQVQVAVINSPSMITLAGDTEVLEPIVAELEEKGRFVRWLRIDYAFHTHQMDPIKDELLDVLGDITANPTKVPFISTVTGREVSGEELDGHYWWRNVREPVLFAPAVAHLIQDGAELFLELGPHPALESSINECLSEQSAPGAVLHSLKRKTDESAQLMRNAAGLFLQGAKLDWKALVGANGEFVRLPRYPWNRDRFWLEGEESRNHRLAPFDHVLLGVRQPSPAPAWQFFLDPRYFKYLEDHRFWDSIVFPAAGYAEIGLAVAKQLFPDDPYAVEELVTKKALFVSEKNVPEVRVTWNEELKMFAVHSRTDSGEWELNAEGRLTKVPFSEESGDLEQIRLALPTHFDHERYYEEYEKAGYQFGPNFQEVRDAWRKDHECLARIVVPEFVRESMHEYRFHPAVLDACFHAVKGAQVIPADGKPSDYFYLPAAIRRVHIYREPLPATLWAHAKVIFDDYASVLADIAVYDEDGNRVADILGFRVDRVDQKDEAEESLDQSFYQFQFEPAWLKGSRAKSKPAFPGGAELVEIANTEAKPIFEKNGLDFYFKELEPATHAMALAYIAQAYESLDFEWTPGKAIELDAFVAATEIPGDHRRLVRAQLNALCETGSIESTGRDSWVIKAPFNLGDPEKLREATKTKFPQFDADTDLCSMCGRALKGIIGGDIDPLEVLFPGGSTSPELHRFYVEGADFPSQNTLLTNVIQGAIKDWPARRAIRVLEVGAGTGSLTRSIAPILPADRSEYLFTDNGAGFLSEAKKAFADFPFIDFASFDIEKDPGEQNIPVGEFDLVLATNVVHATSDLKNTLAQLKKTLAPGGRLIFLEVTRPRAELDIVFGLLKGWWYYKDTDLRPDCALLSPDRWTALLEDCGYDDACWYDNIPQDTGWKAGQSVLIAQRPLNDTVSAEVEAETKPAVTIVGKADKLKAALENIGHTVNVVATGGEAVHPGAANPGIVIHARCLETTDDLGEAQKRGVLDLVNFTHRFNELPDEETPRLFILTRGVFEITEGEGIADLFTSPMVGFLRVARGEHPEQDWTLIDLDPAGNEFEIEDLIEEIETADTEIEVAYRNGQRYGNRLHPLQDEDPPLRLAEAVSKDGDVKPYRLQISTPGMLTNLSLNETRRREPGPMEIEVSMKAGGINFRDVMKALAMYPGNPKDLLWFGDDFSGEVVRVGSDVKDIQPGDSVVGMAPYCFRSYVTVDRRMVFKKAPQLSHVESATLPTVFLTSYYALHHLAHMQPGEKVLIHAGTGGVGQAAIQIAQAAGAEVFATAGTDEKRQLLRDMGVEHVMDSRTLKFADEIMEITEGKGVDIVLNSLAGDFIPKSFSVLAPFGRFLEIGKIDIYGNSKFGLEALKDNISYFVIDLAQHLEHKPELVAGILDNLGQAFAEGTFKPLPHSVFPITDVVEAFRFMAQGKHIGKNVLDFDVPSIQIAPSTEDENLFRPDATYLITGGASGFGFELTKWMVKHGATRVALFSRSGPRDESIQKDIEQLTADGIDIVDVRGDVTNAEDVQRAVNESNTDSHPLKGVIHGAMVLNDEFIIELDEEGFNRTLNPKIFGAWNLHNATLDLDLDHFIGFSSFSAVIGAVRQSNYNAGNYFLDALAHYRRAKGLPALTINWGALTGAGFVERNEKTAAYLNKLGMVPYDMAEAKSVLQRFLPRDPVRVAASRVDWQQLIKLSPNLKDNPAFKVVGERGKEGGAAASIRPQILGAPSEERPGLLQDFITEQVASVFGTDVAKIDRNTPLTNIGLDSLMAIELMNRIESSLGINLPMSAVLNGPNIVELSEPILVLLEKSGDGDEAASAAAGGGAVEKASKGSEIFPLSEGQRALWFLHLLAPESSAYNLVFSAKFTPLIDIDAMKKAFSSLFERHPMLDVTFETDDKGEPMQRLRRGGTIDFRETDATKLSDQEILDTLALKADQPFDLANGPVVRLELLRTKDDAHIVLLSMHHIVSDAWSIAILFQDLIESYFSFKAGLNPDYTATSGYSYEDFVNWEKKQLDSIAGEALRNYWERELEGAPVLLDFPTDHPRPALQTFNGNTHTFNLEPKLAEKIFALAKSENATVFSTLLSAFNALVHRYTRQPDILTGTALAGRSEKAWHDTIGYFVAPLPLRSRVDSDPTFADFIRETSRGVSGAIDNQSYPLTRIIEDMQVPRDPSRSPLFQVSFAMEDTPNADEQGLAFFLLGKSGHSLEVGDMKVDSLDLNLRKSQFDLQLVVQENGEDMYGCWQYNSDLFEPQTIERLNGLFARVLEQVVANPATRISEIELITEEEKSRVLTDWNATTAEYPADKPLHQLFSEQATQTPTNKAVTFGKTSATYEELDKQSNGVAAMLVTEGVKPGDSVGVFLDRSPSLVAGLLGVLKAGANYVPLDPEYPASRLEKILTSAQPKVVLSGADMAESAPSGDWAVVHVDDATPTDAAPAVSGVDADSLAYTIYTSGSTGEPKGVEIPHRAVVNFLTSMRREPGLSLVDRLLAVTTVSFDISVLELFLPLVTGAEVVLASREEARDGRKLAALLEAHDITVMQATPATWRMLLDTGWEGRNGLRIFCGGEALPRNLANLLLNSADEVWNLYGPTETTVWSTCEKLSPAEENEPVTIGKPIDNTQVYILDESHRPVPAGFTGELFIGGDGLARGYHDRDDLTAEQFVDVDLPNVGQTKLYRTGDLARWLPDGRLECLGRADFQIKLRGVRIELGEIETALEALPKVQQAVVVKRTDVPGAGEGLVGYFVPTGDEAATNAELRDALSGKLPEAMVPTFFQAVDALPLTPNRKVDRLRLPDPDYGSEPGDSGRPETDSERMLLEIFNEAFAPRPVGIRDNFFHLGGDSLLAVRLLARVAESFNREIPVAAFLRHPTIEQLARFLHSGEVHHEDDAMSPNLRGATVENDFIELSSDDQSPSKVDAVALAYIPESFTLLSGLDREQLVNDWFGSKPRLTNVYKTHLGSVGIVMLPCFELDLFKDAERLKDITLEALRLSAKLGANTVSLTGALPAATNYGLDINRWMNGSTDLPLVTTGDATRTATVVKSVEGILASADRKLADEHLAIMGLGSIGRGTLELLFEVVDPPKAVTLCDFYQNEEALTQIRDLLLANGYEGEVHIAHANGRLPESVYDASLIIGATSVPGILDTNRMNPGTLLVDYSFPSSFRLGDAVMRLEEKGDFLFTTGGQLQFESPMQETIFLPERAADIIDSIDPGRLRSITARDPKEITGCVFAALLTGNQSDVRVTLGPVKVEDSLAHYKALNNLGATPARLQMEGYFLPEETAENIQLPQDDDVAAENA